jgi:hypothetical protein
MILQLTMVTKKAFEQMDEKDRSLSWSLHCAGGSTQMVVIKELFEKFELKLPGVSQSHMKVYRVEPDNCVSQGGIIYFCHAIGRDIESLPSLVSRHYLTFRKYSSPTSFIGELFNMESESLTMLQLSIEMEVLSSNFQDNRNTFNLTSTEL